MSVAFTLLLAGAAVGCDGGGDPSPGNSVCPTCVPLAGGETTDFEVAPSLAACTSFYAKPEVIDAERATALGFDVVVAKQRIERAVDSPMAWWPMPTQTGEPATGYEANTRVQLVAHVTSYVYLRLDSDLCDGTTCTARDGRLTTEQSPCKDFMTIGIGLKVKTLDGAVDVAASGKIFLWARGPQQEINGQAIADLRDVAGSLKLSPGLPTPYFGKLSIELELRADATRGWLWPTVIPDRTPPASSADAGDDEVGYTPPNVRDYMPLEGEWPPSPVPPSTQSPTATME